MNVIYSFFCRGPLNRSEEIMKVLRSVNSDVELMRQQESKLGKPDGKLEDLF